MIVNTTYANRENKELINELVGLPYSIIDKLRLRGVGSKRMIISEASLDLQPVLNTVSDVNYANIELRPNGILVMINKGLQNYTWIIPYYHLSFFKTSAGSIHADGKFIRFKKNTTYKENKSFFDKLMNEKIKSERGKSIDDFYELNT